MSAGSAASERCAASSRAVSSRDRGASERVVESRLPPPHPGRPSKSSGRAVQMIRNGRLAAQSASGEAPAAAERPSAPASPFSTIQNQEDAPPCSTCGSIMIRSGACYKCVNCGNTSGCA